MNFTVGISGASWANDKVRKLSMQLGFEIAKRNYILLCGGLNMGVMRSVCEGASKVNNRKPIVGILPGRSKYQGNNYLDVSIPTGLGYIRNTILAIASDVVVGISGGAGTLSEIAFAWQYNVPVVLLSNSGGWAERLNGLRLDHRRGKILIHTNNISQALEEIDKIYKLKYMQNKKIKM